MGLEEQGVAANMDRSGRRRRRRKGRATRPFSRKRERTRTRTLTRTQQAGGSLRAPFRCCKRAADAARASARACGKPVPERAVAG
eukprot:3693774-Rhodomonas_salina.1